MDDIFAGNKITGVKTNTKLDAEKGVEGKGHSPLGKVCASLGANVSLPSISRLFRLTE